jgi:hypothetical protein
MKRMARIVLAGASALLAGCGGLDSLDLEGVVIGSEPVVEAQVQVWKLGEDGIRLSALDIEARTDEQGRFQLRLEIGDLPVQVTASGGTTSEYWAAERYGLDGKTNEHWDENWHHHYEAVLTQFRIDEPVRPFVVSPVTTVVAALAEQRFREGMDARYLDSLRQARDLMDEHFDLDTGATIPDRKPGASMTAGVRHALALTGLSDVARDMAERSGYSVESMNTWILTAKLVEDAWGPGALLDGIGPDGELSFDTCSPPCALSGDTLRTELARHLVAGFLRSPQNDTGLDYSDVGEWLKQLMESDVPGLFPGPAVGQLDDGAPVIQMLSSPMADERFDRITFDVNAAPIHDPGAMTIDLAQGFGGNDCPEVYKHINLMWDSADNPIRFRFAVLDDVAGASEAGIRVLVRPEGDLQSFSAPARAAGWTAGGVQQFEATITRADVPRLADTEGRFLVEIHAADWLGHEAAPVRGCWDNRPLPAQPWVGQARLASGPDSLQSVGLEPVNNLAPLLNGVGLDRGKGVMEFDVRNGTDDLIYMTLNYSQPAATYSKSWVETYTALYTSDVPDSTCLLPPVTCPFDLPPDVGTYWPPPMEGTLASLVGGVRVWEVGAGTRVEIPPCQGCDVNEYRLEPRRASGEPRLYLVALVVTNLAELAPRLDAEPPGFYQDIPIDPIDQPTVITGLLLDTFRMCEGEDDTGACTKQTVYRSYRALTRANITLYALTAAGQLSATESLSTYQPLPQANTFGLPLRIEAVQWISNEGPLPLP